MQYAQIILPLNLKGTFTYKVPEEIQSIIQPGMRVLVPFGGKKYTQVLFLNCTMKNLHSLLRKKSSVF
ncbi:hypothetical protein [Chryseobacterium indoltheticum]|uniref:primosomal protein N' family DNA-binding protein n=1 Tax=Chryseobacterium indoltheticum TaxID=254 RepID=UPI003F490DD2